MLVNATEMLKKAKAGHYAVGQFNINNLEWTKAILQTAQELNSPVILGVSEGAGKYMTGYKTVVGMVNGMMEELNITVPVALHLDHGSYDGCLKCVEAGFSSIMFDGSHYPIDENVAKTKELVKIVAEHNMSLEAEVGSIGGEEDGVIGMGECADPKECKMVADLGINFLAAGIGNIHGKYPANWKGLSFETLDAIQQLTGDMPLVLHGGTGIPADMIKKAISLGVSKINVNTECQLAFAAVNEARRDIRARIATLNESKKVANTDMMTVLKDMGLNEEGYRVGCRLNGIVYEFVSYRPDAGDNPYVLENVSNRNPISRYRFVSFEMLSTAIRNYASSEKEDGGTAEYFRLMALAKKMVPVVENIETVVPKKADAAVLLIKAETPVTTEESGQLRFC